MLLPMILFPQISYLPGWPQAVQAPTGRPIYIADIDDDGALELVTMTIGNNFQNDMLYAFENDGTIIQGFPIAAGNFFSGDPALFDSNDDGKLEMAVAQDGNLYLRDQQGNAIWTIPYNGPIFQSTYYPFHVSVNDLDNDGHKEIILTCWPAGGAVFVFDTQGGVWPGWPASTVGNSLASASIGDIDNDGQKEIIDSSDKLYCFKPDGTACPGFPASFPPWGSKSKPVLVDIDGDGYLEIIVGWDDASVKVLRSDGTLYPGYPVGYIAYGISVGDVYRDGKVEFFYSRGGINGYDALTATMLPNFPLTDPSGVFWPTAAAANLCDLTSDIGLEIAAGTSNGGFVSDGKLFAFNLSGSVLPNFPSFLLSHRALTKACAIADADGNGITDICCGSENLEFVVPASSAIYCWDTGHPYNLDNVDWAMDGFDLGHTGRWKRLYHISKTNSTLSVAGCTPTNPCYLPPDGSLISVDVTAVRQFGGANPSDQDVRYSRTLGCATYEGPVIDHGDGTYTRMLRAPTADCTTDLHAWVNEFKLKDYQQIVFTSGCVIPPPAFSLLNPPDGAIQQPMKITLEWPVVGTFPNQATAYDLYFGPDPDPPYHQGGLATPYFDLHGLALGTTYYWRVEARNACGVTSSPVWTFTTACQVPGPFASLCPADGATDLPLDVELAWEASTHATSYQVSIGPAPDALTPNATTATPSHLLQGLSAHTTYYWQARAQNTCGETSGPVWSFTTGEGECRHCRPVSPP